MDINRDAARQILKVAAKKLTPRRAATYGFFVGAYAFVKNAVDASRLFDDPLYPEWRKQEVREPVFIFANPRSGTTMLHRLLSYDEETFAPFLLYQSIFNSVAIQRAIEWVGERDEQLGGVPSRVVDLINKAFFNGRDWEGIHETAINAAEEDEATFALTLDTPVSIFIVPDMEVTKGTFFFDTMPEERRKRFTAYYREVLQRHLFTAGPTKRFITKNVFFTPRVKSMLAEFPDARFIYLVRHPYESVPSFLNLIYTKWAYHCPEIQRDSEAVRALIDFPQQYDAYARELRRTIPEDQLIVLRYEDLVADLQGTVEKVYERFGWQMSDAFVARLEAATRKQRSFSSSHDYSLEQFGLTRYEVYERFKDVFEEFGYDPMFEHEDDSGEFELPEVRQSRMAG